MADFNMPDFNIWLEGGSFDFSLDRECFAPLLKIEGSRISKPDTYPVVDQEFSMLMDADDARKIGNVLIAYADAWELARKMYVKGIHHQRQEART